MSNEIPFFSSGTLFPVMVIDRLVEAIASTEIAGIYTKTNPSNGGFTSLEQDCCICCILKNRQRV